MKISSLILIVSILCYSCSQDDINSDKLNSEFFELNRNVTLKETTSNVSNLMLNMGVTAIKVSGTSNSTLFEFNTAKEFRMNGKSIDLSNYAVILENGKISLKSNSNLSLTLLNDQPYIISSEYSGFIKSEDIFDKTDFNILLLFMKELVTDNSNKVDAKAIISTDLSQKTSGCSFWDTYYVYATGGSRSVSEANLEDEEQEYISDGGDLEGCTPVGESDSSCVWDNHGCIATQAYCCE